MKSGRKKYPFQLEQAMPRQPKLRKEKTGTATYWFTRAGGDTYLGKVATVALKTACSLFNDRIKSLSENQQDSKRKGILALYSRNAAGVRIVQQDGENQGCGTYSAMLHGRPSATTGLRN
jgi:hypothetical protein